MGQGTLKSRPYLTQTFLLVCSAVGAALSATTNKHSPQRRDRLIRLFGCVASRFLVSARCSIGRGRNGPLVAEGIASPRWLLLRVLFNLLSSSQPQTIPGFLATTASTHATVVVDELGVLEEGHGAFVVEAAPVQPPQQRPAVLHVLVCRAQSEQEHGRRGAGTRWGILLPRAVGGVLPYPREAGTKHRGLSPETHREGSCIERKAAGGMKRVATRKPC